MGDPVTIPGKPMHDLKNSRKITRACAGLESLRIHDLAACVSQGRWSLGRVCQ